MHKSSKYPRVIALSGRNGVLHPADSAIAASSPVQQPWYRVLYFGYVYTGTAAPQM